MKYENHITDSLSVSSSVGESLSLGWEARAELQRLIPALVEVKNLLAVGGIDEAYDMLEDILKAPEEGRH